MKSYLPYILLIAGIIIGLSFGGDKEAEQQLIKKLEADRDNIIKVIGQKDAQIIEMVAESREIKEKMYSDSVYYSGQLRANKRAFKSLKKKYNEINLNRATHAELDSILSVLYP